MLKALQLKSFVCYLCCYVINIWRTQKFQKTVDLSGFVIKLFFVRRVQKTLQTSIFPNRNRLDWLLELFFVLLSARSAEHCKSLVFGEDKR